MRVGSVKTIQTPLDKDAVSPSVPPCSRLRRLREGVASLMVLSLALLGMCYGQDATAINRMLVDDFGHSARNALGRNSGAFSDPDGLGYCYVFVTQETEKASRSKNRSLYIKWDTTKLGSWGGYWTDVGHAKVQGAEKLVFSLKGLRGGERFTIGIRGEVQSGTHESKLFVQDVLPGGVTTEWQKVVVPLRRFGAMQKWRSIAVISLNFENQSGSDRGAILIDDISFERQKR